MNYYLNLNNFIYGNNSSKTILYYLLINYCYLYNLKKIINSTIVGTFKFYRPEDDKLLRNGSTSKQPNLPRVRLANTTETMSEKSR